MTKFNQKLKIELIKNIDYSYPIIISSDLNIASEIKQLGLNNHYVIITDTLVEKIYKDKINDNFLQEKLNYQWISITYGEKNKNLKVFEKTSNQLLKLGFGRKSVVIALGGGVVGDLAGYVAGTFMRGIPFIQVPTTLLAQVDSSVGGKVAVDLTAGKNSSGLFYQPKKVIIDVSFLKTLSAPEINNGMMEIIKYGIIRSKEYFELIEKNIEQIKQLEPSIMGKIVYDSCKIKGEIVQQDEKENDLRRILNFGHTFGHALESMTNFRIKHGMAVGIGMLNEAAIASKLGLLSQEDCLRIEKLINAFGIKPVKYNSQKILNLMKNDKKNMKINDGLDLIIPLILPTEIGKVIIKNFTIQELEKLL